MTLSCATGMALMKELIIQNKLCVCVCVYSALSAVNWQFSVVDICEIKKAFCYKEKPNCVKLWVH